MAVIIKSSDRVLTAGKTGSGKTYLNRYISKNISRLMVLDGKGSLLNWNTIEWNNKNKKKFLNGEDCRVRVTYNPPADPLEIWEEALNIAYESKYCTVYIDEIYAIVPPYTKPLNILNALWTRGREWNIGVWSSTQRPSFIPLFALSESDHFFVFRLTLEEDRKRMSSFMGYDVLQTIKDKHGFYYMSAEMDYPTYTPKLNVR